jgi:hypothetical protein
MLNGQSTVWGKRKRIGFIRWFGGSPLHDDRTATEQKLQASHLFALRCDVHL